MNVMANIITYCKTYLNILFIKCNFVFSNTHVKNNRKYFWAKILKCFTLKKILAVVQEKSSKNAVTLNNNKSNNLFDEKIQ